MLLDKKISILAFIKIIKFDIIAICSYAVVVGILDKHSFLANVSIPLGITAIIGTTVSLLLAFRTAQSYERWWEARIIWGSIVNDSRTLIRQLILFLPESNSKKPVIDQFAERQIIWCYALSETLRKNEFSDKVSKYLHKEKIKNGQNIPNELLNRHSDNLAKSGLHEFKQVQLDITLRSLCDAMGKCERIKNTVFPKSYSLLVHLLIYVFTTLIPFGLDHKYIGLEILLTVIIPLIFIAIERTAIIMQDPFENSPMDTPMTSLSVTIEINLKHMIGNASLPIVEERSTNYYIM